MTADEERIDKALDSLSHARTALDDPNSLSEAAWAEVAEHNPEWASQRSVASRANTATAALASYAIDKIDDAMRLLNVEKPRPKFGLTVCRNGVSVTRLFDPEEEAIDAVGAALIAKGELLDDVITILVVEG